MSRMDMSGYHSLVITLNDMFMSFHVDVCRLESFGCTVLTVLRIVGLADVLDQSSPCAIRPPRSS